MRADTDLISLKPKKTIILGKTNLIKTMLLKQPNITEAYKLLQFYRSILCNLSKMVFFIL